MNWNSMLLWSLAVVYVVQLFGALSLRLSLMASKPALLCLVLGLALGALLGLIILVKFVLTLISGAAGQGGQLSLGIYFLLAVLPISSILAVIVPAAKKVPRIHDISTSLDNPLSFEHIPSLRHPSDNPLEFSEKTVGLQKEFYPHIQALKLDLPPAEAYKKAKKLVWSLGWQVSYEEDKKLRIEATARTSLLGFKDDVLIQILGQESGAGSVVHMRSASRVGRSDLGMNARRIEEFLALMKG